MKLDLKSAADPLSILDPDIAEFVRRSVAESAKYPPRESLSPPEARLVALETRRQWYTGGPEMAHSEDRTVRTRHGRVRIRIHRPEGVRGPGAFLYLPGGGWTLFSVDTHDRLMREYAEAAKLTVIGIDYSRAPEAKFPQPIEELDDALDWIGEHAVELGIDATRLALGGDSAGGNLTAATCLARRDAGKWLPAAIVLNYGGFDMGVVKVSVARFGGGAYLLTTHMMVWFTMNYIRAAEDMLDPLASPLRADKRGLPPAFMVITDCDVLYDDNVAMAEALRAAGVEVEARIYPGTVHSFLEAMSIAEVSRRAIRETSAWLVDRIG